MKQACVLRWRPIVVDVHCALCSICMAMRMMPRLTDPAQLVPKIYCSWTPCCQQSWWCYPVAVWNKSSSGAWFFLDARTSWYQYMSKHSWRAIRKDLVLQTWHCSCSLSAIGHGQACAQKKGRSCNYFAFRWGQTISWDADQIVWLQSGSQKSQSSQSWNLSLLKYFTAFNAQRFGVSGWGRG